MTEVKGKSRAVTTLHVTAALMLSCLLVAASATAAEKFRLPFIHSWALAHGTIFVVFPAYFVLSFFILRPLVRSLHARFSAPGVVPAQRVSLLAIASLLVSGVGFLIPVVGSVFAIVLGHLARRRCRARPELSGSGIALAGLVMGYLGLAYSAYVIGSVFWIAATHGS